jgi:regulator of replication initiation timing
MALIVAITGMIYLTQITKTSSFGYQVDKLKNARQDLIEENQALEVEAARLQTLDRIKSSDIAKKLESSNGVHFTY